MQTYLFIKEFMPKYKISPSQWRRRREDLLEHLKDYFDYTIDLEHKPIIIIIEKQWAEYAPLPKKSSQLRKEKVKAYTNYVDVSIEEKPHNTAANLGRNAYELQEKYNHKPGTSIKYCEEVLKDGKHKKTGNFIWGRIKDNDYEYLSNAQVAFLKQLGKDYYGERGEELLAIEGALQYGFISIEDAQRFRGDIHKDCWAMAKAEFAQVFGYWPIPIPEIVRSAF